MLFARARPFLRAGACAAAAAGLGAAAACAPAGAAAAPADAGAAAAAARFTPLDLSRFALSHHLLHDALAGAEKLERYELALRGDGQALTADVRLGRRACGHPRVVHGGALASVFDDAMGTLFLSAGHGGGFTASLTVDYRAPVPAGTDLRLTAAVDRAETSARSGARKVYVTARLEAAPGAPPRLYAEARALFVVKDAGALAARALADALDAVAAAARGALGGAAPRAQTPPPRVEAQPSGRAA